MIEQREGLTRTPNTGKHLFIKRVLLSFDPRAGEEKKKHSDLKVKDMQSCLVNLVFELI